jgi:hypothetical protein
MPLQGMDVDVMGVRLDDPPAITARRAPGTVDDLARGGPHRGNHP